MHPFRHFYTITRHRHAVIRLCFRAGIGWQGLFHDLSKYSPTEFFLGAKYYLGTRSPNEAEREANGFSRAWLHHKGRNRHHFEYWVDIDPVEKRYRPVKMPLRYVAEMFCDRVAASKIYKKDAYTPADPYIYFDRGREKRTIHPETSDFLEMLLLMHKNSGEKETFRYLRRYLKENSDY